MNCREWEERVALYAGGDLPPREAAAAERHLAACAGCREFAEELRQSLDSLRAAHEEPLEPAAFAAVRARVLAQLEPKRRPAWRWAWVPVLAALGIVWLLVRPAPVEPLRVAIAPPPAPKLEIPAAPSAPRKPLVRVHRARKLPPPPGPLMVKLITDDPNVVIYWIAD